jgi:hypothetical protein
MGNILDCAIRRLAGLCYNASGLPTYLLKEDFQLLWECLSLPAREFSETLVQARAALPPGASEESSALASRSLGTPA